MPTWQQWLHQPRRTKLRRALFQLHLWLGIFLALYVILISATGSFLVFRRELAGNTGPVRVAPGPHRLSAQQLGALAERHFPGYKTDNVFFPRARGQVLADRAAQVHLVRGKRYIEHYFNPYTGADLGSTSRPLLGAILWLADLHDDLLAGPKGRMINGFGALLATIMACTGLVLWWPGVKKWKRGFTVDWKRKGYGFHWSLHNALGFWMMAFIVLWGISGIYFAFPQLFNSVLEFFYPVSNSRQPSFGDNVLSWLAKLHFGRFSGYTVKAIWTVLGLAPAVLAITGLVMWWQRVVRRTVRRRRALSPPAVRSRPAPAPLQPLAKS